MDVEQRQESLLAWYRENRRDLPWRETTDPYEVLVAEVMLQQTQVSRVVPKWNAFLAAFPTAEALAEAPLKDVLALWDGLGYNNRAKWLKQAARQVVEEFDGAFPRDPETLQELQGVGEYTANAVASFAFDSGGPVFDTNVRRLLYRFHGEATDEELKAFHRQVFPEGKSREWNNAVMELGAEVCIDGTPRCKECPWREDCEAWRRKDFGTPEVQKQSAFEGSWRFYRAKVLKALMDGAMETQAIGEAIDLPAEYDIDELLAELEEEGMIEEVSGAYRLPG